jgi:hypothetical protein
MLTKPNDQSSIKSIIEYEGTQLNGFSWGRSFRCSRVLKCGMRNENGDATVLDRVETYVANVSLALDCCERNIPLEQNKLLWLHTIEVAPLLILVIFHSEDLLLPIRGQHGDRESVFLWIDTPVVTQPKWPVKCWMSNRPPKVDDLETLLKERVRQLRKVLVDAGNRRLGGLVTMNVRNGDPISRS